MTAGLWNGLGIPRDSVVNLTAVVTLNRTNSAHRPASVPNGLMDQVDQGLRKVLGP